MLARYFALNRVNRFPLSTWLLPLFSGRVLAALSPAALSPRALKKVLLVLSLACSAGLHAQGLGELTLESALDEPLAANIELLNVAGLDPGQISVRLATPDEYEQAGLEYSSVLTNIDIATSISAAGNGVARVTSERRVEEPYLSLLVSARWPAGRVMREYTVLLDLPGRGGRAVPTSLPLSETPRSAPAPTPRPASTASASPSLAGEDSYTVGSGDSLWLIAEQTRPSADVPVPQMMIAIQRANEEAFVNNDINRLLSGRVLRIPAQNEIATVNAAEALALVNAPRPTGAAPLGAPGTNTGAAAANDELSVLTSDDALEAAGSSDLESTIAALENALLLSEEELDRARLENEELTLQLGELEEQIAILQNIIAIEDERLAGLQQELAAQAETTAAALTTTEQATATLASQPQAAEQGMVPRVMQLLTNNLLALGVGLVLVLLVLGFLVYRARQARMEDEDDDDLDFDAREEDLDDDDWSQDGAQDDDETATAYEEEDDKAFLVVDDMDEHDEAPDGTHAAYSYGASGASQGAIAASAPLLVDTDDDNYLDLDDSYLDDADEAATDHEHSAVAQSEEVADYALRQEIDDALDDLEFTSSDLDEIPADEIEIADQDIAAQDITAEDITDITVEDIAAEDIAAEDVESFEFKLDPVSEPEPAATVALGLDEVETFDFSFDAPATDEPEPAKPVPASVDDVETIAFSSTPARTDAPDVDMGNFTFDENDISFEDEDAQNSYTPRTNMDECDTKLDLAVAYEAMGDVEGAVEILEEVITEGKPEQIAEAQRLKSQWQGA